MSVRFWLILSLAANVALGVLVYRTHQPHTTTAKPVLAESNVVQVQIPSPENPPAPEKVLPAMADETFDWSQLVSTDFKVYRDNLRAINCPEPTVRVVITSEINELFAQRRKELVAELQRQFWDFFAKAVSEGMNGDPFRDAEWAKALKKLKEEREALIAAVLGPEKSGKPEKQTPQLAAYKTRYAWLPPEKCDQLAEAEMNRDEKKRALWDTINARSDRQPTEAERSQLAALDKEFADTRTGLLTAEEKNELILRQSNAARWAANLHGFEPTETEWRSVATAQKAFDETSRQAGGNSEEAQAKQREMRDELQQEIAAALGPERFAAYQLAQNGDYQQTRRITQRYQLPEDTARQAYEVQRNAETAVKQLGDDTALDAAARQTALAGIRQESEQALSTLLGAEVFGTYQKYHGNWLHGLPAPAN